MPPFLDFYTLKLSLLPDAEPGILILFMLGVWDIAIYFFEAMVIGEFNDYEMLLMFASPPLALNEWSFDYLIARLVTLDGEDPLVLDWSLWAVWGLFF